MLPQLYMIGGPNGAGKTTVAFQLLPKLLSCYEYINADSIAAALSPFSPEEMAIQAGKLMLNRISQLADVIFRRYHRSIKNFLELYIPLADQWALYDNSNNADLGIIAEKILSQPEETVLNNPLWSLFRKCAYE